MTISVYEQLWTFWPENNERDDLWHEYQQKKILHWIVLYCTVLYCILYYYQVNQPTCNMSKEKAGGQNSSNPI